MILLKTPFAQKETFKNTFSRKSFSRQKVGVFQQNQKLNEV